MAIAGTTIWECRSTGNDENGSGFNPSRDAVNGVDYSQQDAPQLDLTDFACASGSPTVLTSATGGFTHAMEGNLIYIHAGTNFVANWYEIVTYTNTNTVTLDRTPISGGDGSAGHGKVGGAAATPGMIGGALVTGNAVYCKGNQTFTTASTNVSGGCLSVAVATALTGYATTRTPVNTDTKPVFTLNAGVSTATMFTSLLTIRNVSLDGASNTTSKGSAGPAWRCAFANFTAGACSGQALFCTATGCSGATAAFSGTVLCVACEAYANTCIGFSNTNSVLCISRGNTGANIHGFSGTNFVNCVAYANGGNGFSFFGSSSVAMNCVAESNTGYGYVSGSSAQPTPYMVNCAAYNNTAGTTSAFHAQSLNLGFQAITAGSVFVDAANGDFRLNNTANRGALLRAAGFPSTFPAGLTASYADIGAAQHQEVAGGGLLTHPGMAGGMRG